MRRMSRVLREIRLLGESSNRIHFSSKEYHISRLLLHFVCLQVAEADEDHEPEPDGEAGGDERDAER